jgi:release factor glutamine methyltransferase
MSSSIRDALREAAQRLAALPQASPRLEAELLLCDATGLNRTRLMAWPESEVGDADLARFRTLVARRLSGEPIAYIRGHQAFWTLELRVTPDTLIPRPETELASGAGCRLRQRRHRRRAGKRASRLDPGRH